MKGSREVEVREYVTQDGKSPFTEWLSALRDVKGRAIIRARINRIRLGNFGDCQSIDSGISELRIDFGPGYRVYLGQESEVVIVLLCGGDKSMQRRDISKAKEYWQDYRSHSDDEK